jgi:hypothetical protein
LTQFWYAAFDNDAVNETALCAEYVSFLSEVSRTSDALAGTRLLSNVELESRSGCMEIAEHEIAVQTARQSERALIQLDAF